MPHSEKCTNAPLRLGFKTKRKPFGGLGESFRWKKGFFFPHLLGGPKGTQPPRGVQGKPPSPNRGSFPGIKIYPPNQTNKGFFLENPRLFFPPEIKIAPFCGFLTSYHGVLIFWGTVIKNITC